MDCYYLGMNNKEKIHYTWFSGYPFMVALASIKGVKYRCTPFFFLRKCVENFEIPKQRVNIRSHSHPHSRSHHRTRQQDEKKSHKNKRIYTLIIFRIKRDFYLFSYYYFIRHAYARFWHYTMRCIKQQKWIKHKDKSLRVFTSSTSPESPKMTFYCTSGSQTKKIIYTCIPLPVAMPLAMII